MGLVDKFKDFMGMDSDEEGYEEDFEGTRKLGRCSRVLSEFRLCISTLTICYHFQAADIYQEKYRCIWIHRFHSLR